MRAFVEGDFAGSSRVFRLRHAYGQWKGLLVGQTWSTFVDPEAEPDGIDFEGLNAIALFRQPLVRWTKRLGERYSLATAIENPAPDITNAKGVSQFPDIVVRARWRPPRDGHGAPRPHERVPPGRARERRAALPADPRRAARPAEHDALDVRLRGRRGGRLDRSLGSRTWTGHFSAYAGSGIGRYITDLGTLGGQDAFYDPATNTIDALPVFAWYLGYERRWNSDWRSTFTYGTVVVDNIDLQPGTPSTRRTAGR